MININKHKGFSMIEVLISTVVLSAGLLGMAGLQTTGLRSNLKAHHKSQATQLAYDMADRMRANMDDAGNLAASTYIAGSPTTHPACSTTTGCSSVQMAENDLAEWNTSMSLVPSGEGTISVDAAEPIYTIKVAWDDNRDNTVDSDDPDFSVSFRL